MGRGIGEGRERGEWKGRSKDAREKGEKVRGGRKKDWRGREGGKKSKNTPSVNFCLRPCL